MHPFTILTRAAAAAAALALSFGAGSAMVALRDRRKRMAVEALHKLLEKKASALSQQSAGSGAELSAEHIIAIADQLARIDNNIALMDASVRGIKQLSRAAAKIREVMAAAGYEIVDMEGRPFNDGMRAFAEFVIDDTIPQGEQIIKKVIKPQINHNGRMLRPASIIVAEAPSLL